MNDESACDFRLGENFFRLVAILRAERPQVIVTYPEDQGSYQHPDHLRVWDITMPAVEKAADPAHRPDLGEAWSVSKIYASMWSRARLQSRHDAFLAHGLESPYDEKWFERPDQDDKITAKVSIDGFTHARREGLLAHATQIDPESKFWFGLPAEVDEKLHPWDDYMQIAGSQSGEDLEDDLFAGLRPVSVQS